MWIPRSNHPNILDVTDLSKSRRINPYHEHLFLRITVLNSALNTGCDFAWKHP